MVLLLTAALKQHVWVDVPSANLALDLCIMDMIAATPTCQTITAMYAVHALRGSAVLWGAFC